MKVLLAVVTCRAYRARAEAQRRTWASEEVPGLDIRFFVGQGSDDPLPHEIPLPCGDDYHDLPDKVQEVCKWALARGYTHLFKTDDDIYVQQKRLLDDIPPPEVHYMGRVRGPSGGHMRVSPFAYVEYPAPYASGMGYWLDEVGMRIVADAPRSEDVAEDRHTGNVLLKAGIHPVQADNRYVLPQAKNASPSGSEGPRQGNVVVAAGEYEGTHMYLAHEEWLTAISDTMLNDRGLENLARVCILIKTGMRDGFLHRTLRAIERHLPKAKIVVVDDGRESREKIARYTDLRSKGHECLWLPHDSGFGAKANAGVAVCDREYVLIGSDDFNFSQEGVVEGIQRLITVMDSDPKIGFAGGRVDNNPYEGWCEMIVDEDGMIAIKEHPLPPYPNQHFQTVNGVSYARVGLTVNYGLARRSIFQYVRWFEGYKIGGDHFEFFKEVKDAGFQVAFVHGVNINQIPHFPGATHADYGKYRARAKRALPLFFHRQGIERYIAFDGRIDEVTPSDTPIDWSI